MLTMPQATPLKMEPSVSQQGTIARRAKEKGISLNELYTYYDRKIEDVATEHPNQSSEWRMRRVEDLVWQHFCESQLRCVVKQRAKLMSQFLGRYSQVRCSRLSKVSLIVRLFQRRTPKLRPRSTNADMGRVWVEI